MLRRKGGRIAVSHAFDQKDLAASCSLSVSLYVLCLISQSLCMQADMKRERDERLLTRSKGKITKLIKKSIYRLEGMRLNGTVLSACSGEEGPKKQPNERQHLLALLFLFFSCYDLLLSFPLGVSGQPLGQ